MKIVVGPNAYALSDWLPQQTDDVLRISMTRDYGPEVNASDDVWVAGKYYRTKPTPRLDVVIAAVRSQSSLMVNDLETDEQLDVNVRALVEITQACLPTMIRAKYGRFIYLSSIRSLVPAKGAVLYGACKAFGEQLFQGIGVEYEQFNIRTASLRIGFLDGGLPGPRPDGELLTPKQVTASIDYAMHVMETKSTIIDLNGGQPL